MDLQEEDLRAALAQAHAAYHELAQADTVSQQALRDRSDAIKALRKALADLLSKDAKDCPKCKQRPIGHLKTLIPAKTAKQEDEKRTYEVICADCGLRSRGSTIRAATLLWNADEYVKG